MTDDAFIKTLEQETAKQAVQIPPPLPRPEPGSEQGTGLFLVSC